MKEKYIAWFKDLKIKEFENIDLSILEDFIKRRIVKLSATVYHKISRRVF